MPSSYTGTRVRTSCCLHDMSLDCPLSTQEDVIWGPVGSTGPLGLLQGDADIWRKSWPRSSWDFRCTVSFRVTHRVGNSAVSPLGAGKAQVAASFLPHGPRAMTSPHPEESRWPGGARAKGASSRQSGLVGRAVAWGHGDLGGIRHFLAGRT